MTVEAAPAPKSLLTPVAIAGSAIVFLLASAALLNALLTGRALPEDLRNAAVAAHLSTVLAALPLAVSQLVLPKGTLRHRIVGYVWCALMTVTSIVSFGVHTINPGGLSPVHIFSVITLIGVPLIIYAARTERVAQHQRAVLGVLIGGLVIAGAFTFVPGRALGILAGDLVAPLIRK
jgi:uncharacterized membrane protein